MSPLDVSQARVVESVAAFDRMLEEHPADRNDLVIAVYKQASGRQTVTFGALLEIALCNGWVDTQTKGIDEERYAIRFMRRRPGSNWSPRNRDIARRLVDEDRMKPAGLSSLPPDL